VGRGGRKPVIPLRRDANDGELHGSVSFIPGQVEQAFSLDGTGEVLVTGNPNLNVQQFTITAWVFPTLLDAE
jgi:hypothetical protein